MQIGKVIYIIVYVNQKDVKHHTCMHAYAIYNAFSVLSLLLLSLMKLDV